MQFPDLLRVRCNSRVHQRQWFRHDRPLGGSASCWPRAAENPVRVETSYCSPAGVGTQMTEPCAQPWPCFRSTCSLCMGAWHQRWHNKSAPGVHKRWGKQSNLRSSATAKTQLLWSKQKQQLDSTDRKPGEVFSNSVSMDLEEQGSTRTSEHRSAGDGVPKSGSLGDLEIQALWRCYFFCPFEGAGIDLELYELRTILI